MNNNRLPACTWEPICDEKQGNYYCWSNWRSVAKLLCEPYHIKCIALGTKWTNYVAVIKAKLLGATKTWVFKQADSNSWEWGDILRAGLYVCADKPLTIVILTMFSCEFLANPAPGRIPSVLASEPLHSIQRFLVLQGSGDVTMIEWQP